MKQNIIDALLDAVNVAKDGNEDMEGLVSVVKHNLVIVCDDDMQSFLECTKYALRSIGTEIELHAIEKEGARLQRLKKKESKKQVPDDKDILRVIRLSSKCSWEHLQDGWSDMDKVKYIKENWNKKK